MFKTTRSSKDLYLTLLRLVIAFALLASLLGYLIASATGETWSPLGEGVNADVYAIARDNSGNLYAGGSFTLAGGAAANNIARWDGNAWSPLGSGMNNSVYALAIDGSGNLYAGGSFTTAGGVGANRIAKWDGSAWSPLGNGMNAEVYTLAVDSSGNLYAGGNFTTAGGIAANRVARWDGNAWAPLGDGVGGRVNALAFDSLGNLYAGGAFTSPAGRIARWDGSAWLPLGSGVSNTVRALAADSNGNLYVAGSFASAGGVTVNRIARWDGSTWWAIGNGFNADVHTLAFASGGVLYAGGEFTTSGSLSLSRIAQWDGAAWSSLESGMNEIVRALARDGNGGLYAGGGFTTAGSASANHIARWAVPAGGGNPTPTPTLPATPPPSSTTSLTLIPDKALICSGESMTVAVNLTGAADLFGYQFVVHYDPTLATASAVFVNSLFDTTTDASIPAGWNASCNDGICKFAASKVEPGTPVSGSGVLAQLTLTGVNAGAFDLTFSDDILSDREALEIAHTAVPLHVDVCGFARVSGTIALQGRSSPGDAGQVTLTDLGGVFGAYTTDFNPTTGAFVFENVRVLPGGSNYQFDTVHGLYLGNRFTHVLQPGAQYSAPATRLLGGDASNDGVIDLSDLTCIGGSFGGAPATCGVTGSSDITADGVVNILDLVLAGSNYGLASPRVW